MLHFCTSGTKDEFEEGDSHALTEVAAFCCAYFYFLPACAPPCACMHRPFARASLYSQPGEEAAEGHKTA